MERNINIMGRYFLCFVAVFSVLYQSILSDDVNPDAEQEDSWNPFMELLNEYSGLGSYDVSDRHQIKDIVCPNSTCIVNVEGDIVWDIRMQLYSEQMIQHIEEIDEGDVNISLDGCLNLTTVADYNTCMEQVRTRMTSFLDNFDKLFKDRLQESCDETLFNTNCITV